LRHWKPPDRAISLLHGSQRRQNKFSAVANFNHPEHTELEDFGEASLTADNGASGYYRVDWFTPGGLRSWGDGAHLSSAQKERSNCASTLIRRLPIRSEISSISSMMSVNITSPAREMSVIPSSEN
jgi:hypothetical protein